MKPHFILFLYICAFTSLEVAGQCNNPTVYWYDADGDGFGTSDFVYDDISDAIADYYGTDDEHFIINGNVAFGCWDNRPLYSGRDNWVLTEFDLNDSDACITNISPQNFYRDADGDGYGDPSDIIVCSSQPAGYVSNNTDCDDTNEDIRPDLIWYPDDDEDGVGSDEWVSACYQPDGYVATDGDECDDNDTTLVKLTWYLDGDGDGTGGTTSMLACSQPPGYVATTGDECDQDASILIMPVWYLDGDGDGYGNAAVFVLQCSAPPDHVSNSLDRDDGNPCILDSTPVTYYEDYDGDGYGNPSVSQLCSFQPQGFVTNNTDCDDNDPNAFPGTIWYRDGDGDGYGANSPTVSQCTRPIGYVGNHADYDDSTENITNIAPQNFYQDADGDGHGNAAVSLYYSLRPSGYVTNTTDCDDTDPLQHNFTQWYIDQDGDGKGYNPTLLGITNSLRASPTHNLPDPTVVLTTMGCLSSTGSFVLNSDDYDDLDVLINEVIPQFFYADADGDGYGTASSTVVFQSSSPPGYVPNVEDCDDTNALLHPQTVWYIDTDGDGWGSSAFIRQCVQPTGHVSNSLDFDDTTEHITNIAPQNYYQDSDGDGYGNPNQSLYYSYRPTAYVINQDDCDDTDDAINPLTIWYLDEDGDGFGTTSTAVTATTQQCTQPFGFVATNDDYDDSTVHITNIAPQNFYQDADGDGYGNPAVILYYSLRPAGYVTNALDCDDTDKFINPQKIWYQDTDGDGLGNPNVTTTFCTTPTGYVDNNGDLSDTSQYITNIATRTFYYDADGDGFGDPNNTGAYSFAPPNYTIDRQDCNDADSSIHPNTIWYEDGDGDGFGGTVTFVGCVAPADYVFNSRDIDDANPYVTDIPGTYFYNDKDRDGYGDPNDSFFASYLPSGHVLNSSDCNDADATLHPQTKWYADTDNDGYGGVLDFIGCSAPGNQVRQSDDYDDSTEHIINIPPSTFYQDSDTDSFGNPNVSLFYSLQPSGYVRNAADCDDQDARLNPNTVWYADTDSDTFGDPSVRVQQCLQPGGYVRNPWDLDDTNEFITNISPQAFYRDADKDGFGTPLEVLEYSLLPPGYVVLAGDCNDQDPLLHPNTHWYIDQDEDGFGGDTLIKSCLAPTGFVSNTLDLDDSTEFITNKATRTFYYDNDGDGFGAPEPPFFYSFAPPKYVVDGEDCNDEDRRVHPLTEWYLDEDGDGYGVDGEVLIQCEQPEGYAVYGGDCNDENDNQIPGARCDPLDELIDPEEEQTEQENETGIVYADRDRDGFGDPDEPYAIEEVETLLFAWVNDNQDACPEEYGAIKGCPKPLVLETKFAAAHNQVIRIFEQDSLDTVEEEDLSAIAAITDEQLANVQVYPNPTDGVFYAQWDIPIQEFIGYIEILSYPQWALLEEFPFVQQPMAVEIDLTAYPPGIYFVQFHFIDNRSLTRRIIKQ